MVDTSGFFFLLSISHALENITVYKWWWGTGGNFHLLQPVGNAQGRGKKWGWTSVPSPGENNLVSSVTLICSTKRERCFYTVQWRGVAIPRRGSLKVQKTLAKGVLPYFLPSHSLTHYPVTHLSQHLLTSEVSF